MLSRPIKKITKSRILISALIILSTCSLRAQDISFSVYAEPLISWFSPDTKATINDGSRAGFNFGFSFNKYFAANYAFSTGINLSSAGGRLHNTANIDMEFNNFSAIIPANEKVTYKIQYLGIPLGLKFKSNQIGYLTFFSDLGIDPKVVIGGKVDVSSAGISGESAMNELNKFNLAYHIMPGIEYSLGGSFALIFGVGFEKNFLDVTKDINDQPVDKVAQNIIKFRFGVTF
jgi:hypothetical protein